MRAYNEGGNLVAFYPATIGSDEKPAPTGNFKVRRVAWNPDYHYNPKFAWKGVKADHELTIKPGPNNPVGLVWIDLTAPSYGIHGTPEPKNIGKTQSHGCIRMTNWDALDLAGMVGRGSIGKRRRVLARQYHCIIVTMAVTTTGMDRTVAIDYRWADIPNPVSFSFCNFHFHSCRSRCFHDFFARFSRDDSLHQLLRNSSGSLAMFAAIRWHHREELLPPEPESTTAKHPSRFSCRMQYYCLRAGQLYGAADGK